MTVARRGFVAFTAVGSGTASALIRCVLGKVLLRRRRRLLVRRMKRVLPRNVAQLARQSRWRCSGRARTWIFVDGTRKGTGYFQALLWLRGKCSGKRVRRVTTVVEARVRRVEQERHCGVVCALLAVVV